MSGMFNAKAEGGVGKGIFEYWKEDNVTEMVVLILQRNVKGMGTCK